MLRRTIISVITALVIAGFSSQAGAVTHRSTARLHGSPTMNGQARYIEKMLAGHRDQSLIVNVTHAHPFQLLPVRVNGHHIGNVRADASGIAHRRIRSAGHMPVIRTGDMVSVGCMGGVSFEDGENGEFDLQGEVEAGAAQYQAEYQESMDDGVLEREFEVQIEGAAPDTSLDVLVNGVLVGSVITDADGNAELTFQSSDDGNGDDDDNAQGDQPFPDDFPAIAEGATIQIGDVVITLSPGGDDDNNGDNGDDDDGDDGD